ncbi:MAG: hypothetical protein N7Q72_05735, partial [Spiroplasma sp. Tabriz.8]|nr:hypothetical protein [Spiroplasma sp. Tabriz.8]
SYFTSSITRKIRCSWSLVLILSLFESINYLVIYLCSFYLFIYLFIYFTFKNNIIQLKQSNGISCLS